MEEVSKPYCHKCNRSQSNRLSVDSQTSFQWKLLLIQLAKAKVRQWSKVLQWLDLLLLKQCLKTDWAWRMLGYLWFLSHRSPRFSLADFSLPQHHSHFWRITLANGFLAVPRVPFTVFAIIRNCFQRLSLVTAFIRLNGEYYLQIQVDC